MSDRTSPLRQIMRLYHGSPHKFDQFDLSRVGAGEGSQTFGHGIYATMDPETAAQYRDFNDTGRPGHLYQFDVDRAPTDFLNWNLPVGDQNENLYRALQSAVPSLRGHHTGEEAYYNLKKILGDPAEEWDWMDRNNPYAARASERLRDAGIPGVVVDDQGRSATKDFSIFDPDIVRNLQRFRLGGLAQLRRR